MVMSEGGGPPSETCFPEVLSMTADLSPIPIPTESVYQLYTKADYDFAHRLAEDIGALGFSVWLDAWGMRVGGSIVDGVQAGLAESAWMIADLSHKAVTS